MTKKFNEQRIVGIHVQNSGAILITEPLHNWLQKHLRNDEYDVYDLDESSSKWVLLEQEEWSEEDDSLEDKDEVFIPANHHDLKQIEDRKQENILLTAKEHVPNSQIVFLKI